MLRNYEVHLKALVWLNSATLIFTHDLVILNHGQVTRDDQHAADLQWCWGRTHDAPATGPLLRPLGYRGLTIWLKTACYEKHLIDYNRFPIEDRLRVNKRKSLDLLAFRISLACQLVDRFSSRKRKRRPGSFQAKKYVVVDNVHLASVGNHMPKIVSSYSRYRKYHIKEQEKRIRYMCAEGDVSFCSATGFSSFHGK
ncbi:hypothetical protein TNCV_3951121 [Trichonephila clavipes]|nr:hypothetical protein TNCV_3951121 [Trichonephila clavipes]